MERPGWKKVRAKATSAGHDVEVPAVGLRKRLAADDEGLDLFVDALPFEKLLLRVATFLAIDLSQAVLDEKSAELAAASTEVKNLGVPTDAVLVADLDNALDAHQRLRNGLLMRLYLVLRCIVEWVGQVDSLCDFVGVGGSSVDDCAEGTAFPGRRRTDTALMLEQLVGQGQFPHLELDLVKSLNLGRSRKASLAATGRQS